MTSVSTNKGTMRDPKQLLDEEIDGANVAEEVVIGEPQSTRLRILQGRIPVRRLLTLAAIAASISLVATATSRVFARRKRTLSPAFVHRAAFRRTTGGRRVGYEGYRFGRIGRAFLAYTYKVPEVHVHLPRLTYKVPSIRVKLPTASR